MNRKTILLTFLLSILSMTYARSQCTPTSSTISPTECSGSYTSPSGKYTWTNDGTYSDTLTNAGGCDSIITINLSFGKTSSSSINPKACDTYTSPSGRYTWTSSGNYSDTLVNSSGCDSVISIGLTILNSSSASISVTECDSYTSPSKKYVWTSSGTFMDTISNNAGCDSVITVNLTIGSNGSTLDTSVCNSYTSPSGNYTWTKSGTYTDTLTNSAKCDSVITINLSVNSTSETFKLLLCDSSSFTSPSGNYKWTSTGTYYDTIANAVGCDSFMTFDLTFARSTTDTISPKACDTYTSPSGRHTWTTSGNYTDTLVNAAGCDSLIAIKLTVLQSTDSTLTVSACDSYTSLSKKYTWTKTGTYMDTIANSVGCDSVITVNLTIESNGSTLDTAVCNSYTSPSGNYTWTKSGTYTDTLTNSAKCDSVITVNLTIKSTSETFKLLLCDSSSYTSPSGNYKWTSTGTYYDTIANSVGCDSFLTFDLTFARSTTDTISPKVCDTYTSPSGKHTWTTSGSYADTLVNAAGCDSLIAINLTVLHSTDSTLVVSACDSYTSPSKNYTWTKTGTYMDTIANSVGCDSVLTVNLTIESNGSTLDTSECDSYTSPSGNYTWTKSGTYTDTLTNQAGCDSVITINLTIRSNSTNIKVTECDNYTSPSGKYSWNTSGNYTDTLTNSTGCDSVIFIDLTILNMTKGTTNVLVCDLSSYTSPSGKYTWTAAGTYADTITNSVGCDSVLTINLAFHSSTASSISVTVCDAYVSPSSKYTWTKTGTYMDTIANANGCDSVITVDLTVLYSSVTNISPVVCDLYTSPSGKYTWTTSGNYSDTLTNSVGCDSVILISLTVQSTASTLTVTACDSFISPSGKYTWLNTGIYSDTLTNSAKCDSVITVRLTVNYTSTSTISPVACDSYTSPSGKYTWTTSGNYMDTITNKSGCDSIISISLTVNYSTSATINPVACVAYTSPSGNNTWTKSGTYSDVIKNALGCDSNLTINLTIVQPSSSSFSAKACDFYTSPSGKQWGVTGMYMDTIPNAVGCDSVMSIFLTIYKSRSETVSVTSCGSYTSPSGKIWASSGTYRDTITSSVGCDSFITYNLTINQASSATITEAECNTYISPSGKYTWTTAGTYMDTIANTKGCDSVITIHLSFLATSATIQPVVCGAYTSPSGKTWTQSGTYMDTILNSEGCDSVITINLTVNNATSSTQSVSACKSYTSPTGKIWTASGTYHDTITNSNGCDSFMTFQLKIQRTSSSINPVVCIAYTSPSGKIWTASGNYLDTIPNAAGCDSVISINLVVKPIDTSVEQDDDTLTAVMSPAGYQWLDCDNGYAAIPGATLKSFKPDKTGNYAVQVRSNGCVDTSACYYVDIVGIFNPAVSASALIFPNPGDGTFTIDLLKGYQNVTVTVTDLNGRLIREVAAGNARYVDMTINDAPRGMYLVTIQTDEGIFVSRFMKQ